MISDLAYDISFVLNQREKSESNISLTALNVWPNPISLFYPYPLKRASVSHNAINVTEYQQ